MNSKAITYTVTVDEYGHKCWRNADGQLHREDGPATMWANGSKAWYINGVPHREDGPAVESANGGKAYYINGKLHREDGPAVENVDGDKEWWINGVRFTEKEFNARNAPCDTSHDGEIIELGGKKYKLTAI